MIEADEDLLIRLTFDLRQIARGDWTGTILVVLSRRGRMQYRRLRDEMAEYSFVDPWSGKKRALRDSELSRTLTRMTEDGLLKRNELPGQWHPAVSYELSDHAHQMLDKITVVLDWAATNRGFFARAQQRRRSARTRGQCQADTPENSAPTPTTSRA